MICAVYTSRFSKRETTWSPYYMKVIDVVDGDIQRVARSLAKSYGKLEDCTFTVKGDAVEFRVSKNDTPYRVRIEPLNVEEM